MPRVPMPACPSPSATEEVLEAYDHYVEPMNQMMDSGSQGTFYRYLEEAERALDQAFEQLSVQGALYSHRLQLRQVAHQAEELRRFGRLVAQQCADTLLPLREELRQHNALTSAISLLLGQVRKRGLRRALSRPADATALPVWRNERGFKLQLGDEVRAVMAAARQYQPQAVAFRRMNPAMPCSCWSRWTKPLFVRIWPAACRWKICSIGCTAITPTCRMPPCCACSMTCNIEPGWQFEAASQPEKTTLQTIRVLHHPHRVSSLP